MKKKLTDAQRRQALDDLAKLEGLPPYDGGSNIVRGDGYFAKSLERQYGMSISELTNACGFDKYRKACEQARTSVMDRFMKKKRAVTVKREFR